jgi:hypothetical protein
MRRFPLQASFITVPMCVRASRVVQYTRNEFAVNKKQKNRQVLSCFRNYFVNMIHTSPLFNPPSPKPKWRHSICIMSQGCQRVGFLHPSHWNSERSVWCTNWLVLELFECRDSTVSRLWVVELEHMYREAVATYFKIPRYFPAENQESSEQFRGPRFENRTSTLASMHANISTEILRMMMPHNY